MNKANELATWYNSLPEQTQALLAHGGGYISPELRAKVREFLPTLYASEGFEVTLPVKGNNDKTSVAVAYWHDGVQYMMDTHGKLYVEHTTSHLKLIIERHHSVVKEIYDYCVGLNVGDIWAMSGGGCQLQVFFGNTTGYLGTLYLDMDDSPMGKSYGGRRRKKEDWTFQVNRNKNDPLFTPMQIKGVKVRTCFEVYGPGY